MNLANKIDTFISKQRSGLVPSGRSGRVYLKPGEKTPHGEKIHRGKQGGLFYLPVSSMEIGEEKISKPYREKVTELKGKFPGIKIYQDKAAFGDEFSYEYAPPGEKILTSKYLHIDEIEEDIGYTVHRIREMKKNDPNLYNQYYKPTKEAPYLDPKMNEIARKRKKL